VALDVSGGKLMFYDIVKREVEKIAAIIITGEFVIGIEPFIEYVYFYCVSDALQRNKQAVSLLKYHNSKIENIQATDTISEVDSKEEEYDKLVDFFNGLNFRNQIEFLKRKELEKEKGKLKRFEGVSLFNFQLSEFEVLTNIKGQKMKENTTYKRIVSPKGYLHRSNFTEIKEFHDLLWNEINNSEEEHKNIRFYKLEKLMGFELMKSTLKALHESRDSKLFDEHESIDDLLLISPIPLIKDRHKYAELYVELDWADKQIWRIELQSIMTLLKYSIAAVQMRVKETKYNISENADWNRFDEVYLPPSYVKDYKIRKDFYAEDFKVFMRRVDKHNIEIREKAKSFIEKNKEE
jgi:hypothetical protein